MSMLTDVGVQFNMKGGDDFASRLQNMENQWKSFSSAMDKTPQVNQHFEKMTASAEKMHGKISSIMGATKAVILGALTAKAGSGLFDWAIGNKGTAEAKSFTSQFVDPNELKAYESAMSRIRNEHDIAKADLYKGAYQIDSAMAGKPLEDKIRVFEMMAYYAKLTGKSFEDASKLYKSFLASFGNTLPLEKQKTFASDTLGMLFKIGQISSSDPQQVADAVGQAGQTYAQLGLTQARMFAEISAMTPMLGGKPEMAAVGLRSLYPEAGTAAGKLAAAAYEEAFAKGQVSDKTGRTSRNWGSLRNLEVADKEGNAQAKKDLAEMKRNSKQFSDDTAVEIQKLLDNKDIEGLWKRMGELVEQNKSNPQSAKILKDAFGLERINIALGMIGLYQRGEIQNLMKQYDNASGQEAIDARRKADENSLPQKMQLLTQKAEDLSSTVRGIFYEPMKALLEEWKLVFEKLEKDFTGEGGMKKIQGYGGELVMGYREGQNQGLPVPGDSRSLGQIFQEFIASLNPEDFRNAGKRIGQAANDFVTIASQLKQIIGSVYSALDWMGILKPLAISLATPGPLPAKVATGMGYEAYEGIKAITPPQGGPLDERGMIYPTPIEKPVGPALQRRPQPGENYMPPQLQAPAGGWGLPQINVTSQPQVTINCDDQKIKDALKAEVKDEIKEDIQSENGRNRFNANDQGLF